MELGITFAFCHSGQGNRCIGMCRFGNDEHGRENGNRLKRFGRVERGTRPAWDKGENKKAEVV